jgi:hypothetical protein
MTAAAAPPSVTVPVPGWLAAPGTGPGCSVMLQPAAPAAVRPEDSPHRAAGRPRRADLLVRPPAFRVLWQRVGQHRRDDVAAGPAHRRRGRRQHGRFRLGHQHGGLRALHPGVRNLERLRPPDPASPRPTGHGDRQPARCRPDRRRNGPSPARRHGGRSRPPAAQRALRAPRRPRAAARTRRRLSARTPAAAPGAADWLPGFRDRAAALLAARRWQITAAMAVGNLALWLVLLACLRGIGLSQAQVPWQTSFAAFAFVRLLTMLPVTPAVSGSPNSAWSASWPPAPATGRPRR